MGTVIELRQRAGSLTLKEVPTGRARVVRPDFPVWEQRGWELANRFRTDQWAWARWWIEGTPWSRKRTALVNRADWPGPSYARLRTLAYVAQRTKLSLYKDSLSFSHHEAVASLPFDIAMEFLRRSLDHGWIVERLKADIASHRQSPQPTDSNTAVAPLITPVRRYTALYADVPWRFDHPIVDGRVRRHYPTMALPDIIALPVADLAAKSSYLFLWVPNALLPFGLAVMNAWGFCYVANLAWIKRRLGGGNYWRNAHELLLLGVRGGAGGFLDKTLLSWLEASPGRHSEKPEQIRAMIERAVPGPYVEMFARSRRPGWDYVWSQ